MPRKLTALTAAVASLAALCGTSQAAHAGGPTPGLWAWGGNFNGQLGVTGTSDSTVPVEATGMPSFTALGAGQNHSLGVAADGTVWAWGDNFKGQLGNGTTSGGSTPVQASGLSGATAVAGGNLHSLALLSNGTVWAWGWNIDGQLGNGTTVDSTVPVQASGLSGVRAIASGYNHSLALKSDGTVWTWGAGVCGEMGNGGSADSDVPAEVPGLDNVVAIAGGYELSMAVKTDGTLWVWGRTCQAVWPDTAVPVQVSGISGAVAAANSIVLESDGTVWWAANGPDNQAQQVPGLAAVTAIASSGGTGIATESDGSVWTWGYNQYGQLGDGTTTNSDVAVQVSGLANTTAIAEGGNHSLAMTSGDATTSPSAPQNLTAQPGTAASSIQLAWQAPVSSGSSAITSYRVYRGTTSGAETFLASVPAPSLDYSDTGLQVGTAYYYEVTAVNSIAGPPSNEASSVPAVAPSAPQNLVAQTGISPGSIQLGWQAPASSGTSAITAYRIYRGTASGAETLVAQVAATSLAYSDSNLPLATYYYEVSAVNTVEGPLSNEASALPLTAPSAPLDLVARTGWLPGSIQLTWQAPASQGSSAITAYRIYRGTASGSETFLTSVPSTSSSYTDSGLSPTTLAYWYQVSAVNTIEGPRSNQGCASPIAQVLGCPS